MRRTSLTIAAISGAVVVVAGFVFPRPSRVFPVLPSPPAATTTTTTSSSSSSSSPRRRHHAVRRSIFFGPVRRSLDDDDDEEGGARRRRQLSSEPATTSSSSWSSWSSSSSSSSTPSSEEAGGRRRSWEESYALLVSYGEVHGHVHVPQSDRPLGPWVNRQRIEHARYLHNNGGMLRLQRNTGGGGGGGGGGGTTDNRGDGELRPRRSTSMTARRKELLDEIGFVWDAMGHSWNAHYAEL